jgi:hypothetical protein
MRKPVQQRLLERLEAGRLMSCCSDPPPPPDMSGVTEASEEIARMNQQTAQEQLAWAREQDGMNRETLNRVLGVQLPAMQAQADAAVKDRARYENVFQPLENNLIKEFNEYDTPGKQIEERGRAIADVNTAFDSQRRNALQRLESYGVDPSQTRNAALDIGVRTAQAAAQAQAATNAGRNVEATGRALRADAINIGKGMPSQVAQSYGTALQAGNSAVAGGAQTTGAGVAAAGSAIPFSQTALQGYNQSAGIQNQGFQNQMAGWQAKQDQTMGWVNAASGIAGMAMMADGGKPKRAIPFVRDDIAGEGHIPEMGMGDGSGIDDTIPAMVSEGEYVIPADVVKAKGTEFFDKLCAKYHTPAAQQEQQMAA